MFDSQAELTFVCMIFACVCRVALLGLGCGAAAVAQCKQYVVQIPCDAQAGLHKVRTKLEGTTVRGLPEPLNQALNDLQVHLTTSDKGCLSDL